MGKEWMDRRQHSEKGRIARGDFSSAPTARQLSYLQNNKGKFDPKLLESLGICPDPDDKDSKADKDDLFDTILHKLLVKNLKTSPCLTAARPAVEAFTAATLKNYSSIYTHDTVRQKLQEHSVFSAASERRSFASMSDVAAHPAQRNFDLPSYTAPKRTNPTGSFADQSGPGPDHLSQKFAPEAGLEKYQVPALSVFNQKNTFDTGVAAQNDHRYLLRNGTFSP